MLIILVWLFLDGSLELLEVDFKYVCPLNICIPLTFMTIKVANNNNY